MPMKELLLLDMSVVLKTNGRVAAAETNTMQQHNPDLGREGDQAKQAC